ncbi:MAG: nucleotidyltransferase family protein [Acidimicrobiia bacterium]|nr:nucleotidyltransferase family protein [Acidimicrobiia bacterium]MDH4306228.1 nucleotidyltransferase family protein [Acidimicrobiia bacterium]
MIAGLILAAGGSRRLGRPKQLEPWGRDATLLGTVVDTARSFGLDELWIVLGSEIDEIMEAVDLSDIGVIENPEWEEGLASSIRVGLDALTRMSRADAVFLILGDQPGLDPELVATMITHKARSKRMAIVPKYRYMWGHPVLVDRTLWPRLISLSGDEGAKRLLQAHPEWVEEVWVESLPPRDVDTSADVEELRPRR